MPFFKLPTLPSSSLLLFSTKRQIKNKTKHSKASRMRGGDLGSLKPGVEFRLHSEPGGFEYVNLFLPWFKRGSLGKR